MFLLYNKTIHFTQLKFTILFLKRKLFSDYTKYPDEFYHLNCYPIFLEGFPRFIIFLPSLFVVLFNFCLALLVVVFVCCLASLVVFLHSLSCFVNFIALFIALLLLLGCFLDVFLHWVTCSISFHQYSLSYFFNCHASFFFIHMLSCFVHCPTSFFVLHRSMSCFVCGLVWFIVLHHSLCCCVYCVVTSVMLFSQFFLMCTTSRIVLICQTSIKFLSKFN